MLASVGFTVALFFATAAVGPGPTLSALKMGALMTAAGALAAIGRGGRAPHRQVRRLTRMAGARYRGVRTTR